MTDEVTLLREIDEYLSGNPQNAVWPGSKLHQSVRSHLRTPRVEAGDGDLVEALREADTVIEDWTEILRDGGFKSSIIDGDAARKRIEDALSRRPSEAVDTTRPAPSRRLTGAEVRALELAINACATAAGRYDRDYAEMLDDAAATLRALADRLASEDGAVVEPTTHNQESDQ